MKKLILENKQSPGDIVMMTAAIREIHSHYPGQFLTDVRTPCKDLWLYNPHITQLDEGAWGVQKVYCHYPLIHTSNEIPHHFLFGMMNHLNEQLSLQMQPRAFKGDIYLSDYEKSLPSRIKEITGDDEPFWIIDAGGKYDFTAKWWSTERYQQVVDHFKDRIRFVQIGEGKHYHPELKGVINLVGKTSLRELVLLMHHAQGVLTPVSLPMHLAAAVETIPGRPPNRPCVVIAGGREPVAWEAYGHHQYIHTVGSLPCCQNGGCWKARVKKLDDGSEWDAPNQICVDVVDGLPHCLHMITAEEVCGRIEQYFSGGLYQYLQKVESVPDKLDLEKPKASLVPPPRLINSSGADENVKATLAYELCSREWEYDIMNYHCRPMTFSVTGRIQQGAGELEQFWQLEPSGADWVLCLYAGTQKTVQFRRTSQGNWEGAWLTWDRSRVRLRMSKLDEEKVSDHVQRDRATALSQS